MFPCLGGALGTSRAPQGGGALWGLPLLFFFGEGKRLFSWRLFAEVSFLGGVGKGLLDFVPFAFFWRRGCFFLFRTAPLLLRRPDSMGAPRAAPADGVIGQRRRARTTRAWRCCGLSLTSGFCRLMAALPDDAIGARRPPPHRRESRRHFAPPSSLALSPQRRHPRPALRLSTPPQKGRDSLPRSAAP